MISAIGPPCQPDASWHACFPALTVIPNYLLSGIVAGLLSLSIIIWAVGFVQRKRGGMILLVLSTLLVPVGGGFVPAFIGIIAGIAGTRIHAHLSGWQDRLTNIKHFLSKLWPWILGLIVIWLPGSWIMGFFFSSIMLELGFLLFLAFDILLPMLIVFTAQAKDTKVILGM
jgi:hypothetical protein